MAFASVGTIGTATSTTAGTSLVLTPTNTLEAGNLGILAIALDNTSTTDGNTSEISTVVDSVSNTWTKLREFCNSQGGSNAGATISVWYTKATSGLTSAGTVTITLANSKTSKAASLWEFTLGATSTIADAGGAQDLAGDGVVSPGSMTISGLANQAYLFFRACAQERRTGTLTPTASYTIITTAVADSGAFATSMTVKGEFIIVTGTGSTSNPVDNAASADWASTFIAIKEVSASSRSYGFIFG